MKKQYFTDEPDCFKWDFLEDVLDACPRLARFTNLTMLTPPDASGEGDHRKKYPCGQRRRELYEFLQECRVGNCDVAEMQRYYRGKRFAYWAYNAPYRYDDREAYFKAVHTARLRRALIFFDPDIGLEWSNRDRDKYLGDDSLGAIASRSTNAIISVYQHLQRHRGRSPADLEERCRRLALLVRADFSGFVSDGTVAILAATRDADLREILCHVVLAHADKHSMACGGFAHGGVVITDAMAKLIERTWQKKDALKTERRRSTPQY